MSEKLKVKSDKSEVRKQISKFALVAAFVVLLLAALVRPSDWQVHPKGLENFRTIGEALFGPYLLAFEVLSLLLLTALIGAVFLARRSS